MACNIVKTASGMTLIACGPNVRARKCAYCSRPHTKLCDFIVTPTNALGIPPQTCDKPLCGQCARHTEPDTDVCRIHPTTPEAK